MSVACLHPKTIINLGVYEAVAFSKFVHLGERYQPLFGINKFQFHSLYNLLKQYKNIVRPEDFDNYYTLDRFGNKVPLFCSVPCNHCILCEKSKSNALAQRLQAEANLYDVDPYFVTLTYNKYNLPKNNGVSKRVISEYIKRLRNYTDTLFRFYGQGEYGKKNNRAHYHFIIFGLPKFKTDEQAHDFFTSAWRTKKKYFTCENGKIVRKKMPLGFVYVSQINDPRYADYFRQKHGYELNPADGLKYCCKYSSKNAPVRSWSLGLGKQEMINQFWKIMHSDCCPTDLVFTNKYGGKEPLIVNRWLLQSIFKTWNRSTYKVRSSIYKCIESLSTKRKSIKNLQWFVDKYKPYFDEVGINFDRLNHYAVADAFWKRYKKCRDAGGHYRKIRKLFSFYKYFEVDFCQFDGVLDDDICYRQFIKRYFSNVQPLTDGQIQDKYYKAIKYENLSLTFQLI